jgi:hypothetical protein
MKLSKLLLTTVAITTLLCGGCKSITGDPVIVSCERTLNIALDTFDSYLKFEYENRAMLKNVSVEFFNVAEKIRKDGKLWIKTLNTAKQVYKANKTSENQINVLTAIAVLEFGLSETRLYLVRGQTTVKTQTTVK